MTSQPEITIPTTSTSTTSKPYTIYNITLRLPLRTFTLQKRYSDFTTLHATLSSQSLESKTPPISPPPKSYFTSTTSSPALAESRRHDLERYLQTINTDSDDRWRNTPAWRSFLNLPSTSNHNNGNRHAALRSNNNLSDPVAWLDAHRALKTQLHDARLAITKREQASSSFSSPQQSHEYSAAAKKNLVAAGTAIGNLDAALKGAASDSWGREKLGEGEMRRRRDLVSSARKEKEGLENLMNAMAAKSGLDAAIAEKTSANGDGGNSTHHNDKSHLLQSKKPNVSSGRVLGKETDRTRALDNTGVLQLQQQLMAEQDEDVDVLGAAVRRQGQIAVEIQEELERQKDMLGLLDEDVDRVQGKMDVARKRVGKLS
ncbi:MAG: hypothetical protein Q9220_006815 [cf. Caloplaca sp. 1 TL-2023]